MKTREIRLSTSGNAPVLIGNGNFTVIAGPCSIESKKMLEEMIPALKISGMNILRGGIFKLRTHADSFQGLGSEIISGIKELKQKFGVPFITEITDVRMMDALSEVVDIFQVGSRSMYQYPLLSELGRQKIPVMLKRAFSATVDEWLQSAQYITNEGNQNVILCERGIRTFDSKFRNTLDLATVAYLKLHSDFPVLVDPSHGTGNHALVKPMALAAAAAGADGIMVEVHPNPLHALSDGQQSITLKQFDETMKALHLLTPLTHPHAQ